ncbi:hypothetical protein WMF37_02020 [Sorangium sp. So ce291]|uniref:tetratricopeptide repeat protein n=1 Tax=Sorangium sp. So ce291 TaxID=3133294 RepID=UPI003F61A676
MMRPLSQRTDPTTPLEADAVALLRAAEPYQPPPGRKQRVRERLLARGAARPSRAGRVPIALAFVVFATAASAAAGRGWIGDTYRSLARGGGQDPAQDAGAARGAVGPEASAEAAPGAGGADAKGGRPGAERAAPPEPAPAAPAAPDEVNLVFEAMRLVRQERQPERAARLLDEYLRGQPRGALAEEALALSIECAMMRQDPAAKELAERYLARYPGGRFRPAAEKARARWSP